jgi:hypothetical protein
MEAGRSMAGRQLGNIATLVRLTVALGMGLLVILVALPAMARADGSWLDSQPVANWNVAGAALPVAAPSDAPSDSRYVARERAPETPSDAALVAAGWRLFTSYQAGWGVTVALGATGYDGMGRPLQYQAFVFVDGQFAGTLSPELMDSRMDGALDDVTLAGPDALVAEFRRYTASDPLCCPSGGATVQYAVQRTAQGPVVAPLQVMAAEPVTPAAPAPATPPTARILIVDEPAFGAVASSPVEVRGRGSITPFESTLVYRVHDAQGNIVGMGPIMVQATMGEPFTFDAPISFEVAQSGQGWIEILEPNAAGGPAFISVSVPVTLTAPGK